MISIAHTNKNGFVTYDFSIPVDALIFVHFLREINLCVSDRRTHVISL